MPINVFLGLKGLSGPVKLPQVGRPVDGYLQLEIKGYHFGVRNPRSGPSTGGAGAGRVTFGSLIVTKEVDTLTPGLLQVCGLGAHFDQIRLSIADTASRGGTSAEAHVHYTFRMAFVSNVQWSTSNADDVADEHVTFSFGAVSLEYRPRTKTGALLAPVQASWDIQTNAPVT